MHKYINAVLQKLFGVRIQRVEKTIKQNSESRILDRPIYLEFVGVPGVGKTTLFNEFVNVSSLQMQVGGGNTASF